MSAIVWGTIGGPERRKRSQRILTESSNTAKIAHNLGLAAWFGGVPFRVGRPKPDHKAHRRQERARADPKRGLGPFQRGQNFASMAAALLAWKLGSLKDYAKLRAPALMLLKNLLLGGRPSAGSSPGSLAPGSPSSRPRATRRLSPERSPRPRPTKKRPALSA